MKQFIVKGLCLAGIVFVSSCNNDTTTESTKSDSTTTSTMTDTATTVTNSNTMTTRDAKEDTTFAIKAAVGGLMEVQLGQLALKNASSSAVKHHAQMMITDHGKANGELKKLAATKKITLPTRLDEDKQKKYADLKAKKGADFDKAYTDLMVDDHKEDVDAFKKQAENGMDADLKSWAAGKLPTLQQHLQMWESTKDTTKKQ